MPNKPPHLMTYQAGTKKLGSNHSLWVVMRNRIGVRCWHLLESKDPKKSKTV